MVYRAPIRSMRSTSGARVAQRAPAFPPATDLSMHLAQLVAELEAIKTAHEKDVRNFLAEAATKLEKELARGRAGVMPIAGVHYQVPNEAAISARIQNTLKQPKDGKDADPKAIAKLVLGMLDDPRDGKDADQEAIVAAVVGKFAGGNVLRPEHIAGLREMLADLRAHAAGVMRGGGDTVVAGTNVTITKNAAGRKVIDATGGFTELAAAVAEIPNGVLKVFTFAAATAQPSFVVSDNVFLKAITKAGTVNWTWNAGTKKATLAVPPQDDIFAIV